jgi:hypothetical protein
LELYKSLSHDVQRILDIVIAPMYSKICITAIEMDIFSLLAKAQTAGALAEKQGWHALNTELFLDAVASLEFVKKEAGVYSNTALANKYLVRGKPDFIGKYLVELYRSRRSEGVDLEKMVRSGPANETPITMDNVSFTDMADMMRKMQLGGRSLEVVDMLRSLPEYGNAKKMLDLGCGAGIIGIAAIQAHPTMHGILYDVPDMGDAVKESIRMQKAEARVQFMGGNYLTDNLGSDYDIMLAIGTLNFAKSSLVPLMEKVHASLNEGGVMICVGDGVHKDGTSPKDVLAGWLVSGLQGADYRMHQGMIANAALKAGFRNVRTLANIASYMGTIDIEILRK